MFKLRELTVEGRSVQAGQMVSPVLCVGKLQCAIRFEHTFKHL